MIELLKSSVKDFNQYRVDNPDYVPNLRNANLHNANLRNANLKDANLHRANLKDANLHGVDLRDANLYHTDLRDADLRDADLRNANLGYTNLGYANLRDANLCDANLCRANLRDATLQDANLRGADLGDAIGNNGEIQTYQFPEYTVVLNPQHEVMWCGCTKKTYGEWRDISHGEISSEAQDWWSKYRNILMELIG